MALEPRVLDEAADWLMRLHDRAATDADRRACERWRLADPEHARAWSRAELLLHKLGELPAALAMPALGRPAPSRRRAAITKFAAMLAVLPAGWLAWRAVDDGGWTAEHRVATGERRELMLADGSRVTLNSSSALDVRFDAGQRLLVLRTGEILVATAPDRSGMHRPFRVATRQGLLEALGTRFTVRQDEGRTRVAVLDGAVRVSPSQGAATSVIQAGQQTTFTQRDIDAATALDPAGSAWTRGMLLADSMRLADFAAELTRYRTGLLHCDAAVANLRISGAFPIDDTDRVLRMLVSTYPVEATMRLRGHWVTLVAR
jgi:transmembrane sensor